MKLLHAAALACALTTSTRSFAAPVLGAIDARLAAAAAAQANVEYARARDDYRALLKETGLTPRQRARAYAGLALTYQYGFPDDALALKTAEAALVQSPSDWLALVVRGRVEAKTHQVDRAMKDFARAIAVAPHEWRPWAERGDAEFAQGRNAAALKDYNRAIATAPRNGAPRQYRGRFYFMTGRSSKSLADLDAGMRWSRNWVMHETRSDALWGLGSFEAALQDMRQVVATPEVANAPVDFAYERMRLHILNGKLRIDDARSFAADADRAPATTWPQPVMQVIAGKLSRDQALADIDRLSPQNRLDHECDVDFYVGEAEMNSSRRREGLAMVRRAINECGPLDVAEEHWLALADVTARARAAVRPRLVQSPSVQRRQAP